LSRRTGFASAKVNLYLHVGAIGGDGYHPIDSLMVFADVGDILTLEPASAQSFTTDGAFSASAPMDQANLVMRAARTLIEATGGAAPGFALHLEKRLPVAAGLGGGSSDAAAALRLVNAILPVPLEAGPLQALAAGLGADVPACLAGVPVIARGRGEQLSRAPQLPAVDAVLVNPLVASPTGPVFAAYDRRPPPAAPLGPVLPDRFETVEALADWLRARTRNDLEAPSRALTPEAGEAIDLLAASPWALLSRMSGSGATAFALCAGAEQAQALAVAIAAQRPAWWVRACRLGAVPA
jgi:4-diphosphocytidyl-2-C-methyl-D-erythritol kinase